MFRGAVNIGLVLASGSPRRKEILEKMGLEFEVIPSDFEENLEDLAFDYGKIEDLAYNKALCVAKRLKEKVLVIGADTVVVLDEQILGKPKDYEDAKKMLENLSGKTHFVVTSICVLDSKTLNQKVSSVTSHVEFEFLSSESIENYLTEYKPYDKAGSYGIQELPTGFVKDIKGSFENIVGLCPLELEKILRDFAFVRGL